MRLGDVDGLKLPYREGVWLLDEDDMLLAAMLADPIYATELLWDDPTNQTYAGCYRVRDYQYVLFRTEGFKKTEPVEVKGSSTGKPAKVTWDWRVNNYAGNACARSVGKTESIKAKAFTHAFRRHGQNLLLTAPELIHLLPLTDAVELRIRDCRLTRDFLDTRAGKTGFTHRPFGVNWLDGTAIVGRIPRLKGTGVKGQHQPDLIVDEGQDYPEAGWTEVHETVMKDTVDVHGDPDFTYYFYGVHSGARDTGFYKRSQQGAFVMIQVTALQRPGWGKEEKNAAKAAYGGTSSPDYRRNIYGEPGAAASAFFVISRLMACLDQDRESDFNEHGYKHIELRAEEVDELGLPIAEVLDLPSGLKVVSGGMDVGLTNSPTVITLFNRERVKVSGDREAHDRLKLFRRITLERFRTRQIREALYAIAWAYGPALRSFGMDVTGLGFPMWQEMEDDEAAPPHLMEVSRGYFFNAKVPVGVDPSVVSKDQGGRLRDQFGAAVVEETDPLTGVTRLVTYMPMIEASTRYCREDVDSGFYLLPFDTAITTDLMGETQQRVKRVGELKKKPNAFHILDAMRAESMARRSGDIEDQLIGQAPGPVLERVA